MNWFYYVPALSKSFTAHRVAVSFWLPGRMHCRTSRRINPNRHWFKQRTLDSSCVAPLPFNHIPDSYSISVFIVVYNLTSSPVPTPSSALVYSGRGESLPEGLFMDNIESCVLWNVGVKQWEWISTVLYAFIVTWQYKRKANEKLY